MGGRTVVPSSGGGGGGGGGGGVIVILVRVFVLPGDGAVLVLTANC
jgi:hypothetical protein